MQTLTLRISDHLDQKGSEQKAIYNCLRTIEDHTRETIKTIRVIAFIVASVADFGPQLLGGFGAMKFAAFFMWQQVSYRTHSRNSWPQYIRPRGTLPDARQPGLTVFS